MKSLAALKGHTAHTQNADLRGLPGKFPRPIKLTMLGAGSSRRGF